MYARRHHRWNWTYRHLPHSETCRVWPPGDQYQPWAARTVSAARRMAERSAGDAGPVSRGSLRNVRRASSRPASRRCDRSDLLSCGERSPPRRSSSRVDWAFPALRDDLGPRAGSRGANHRGSASQTAGRLWLPEGGNRTIPAFGMAHGFSGDDLTSRPLSRRRLDAYQSGW